MEMNSIPKASSDNMGLGANMGYAFMLANLDEGVQKKIITDEWGYKWNQESVTGYRREHDGFFLPNMQLYDHYNHSVEARIEIWEQIKNSKGVTVVGTMPWPFPNQN